MTFPWECLSTRCEFIVRRGMVEIFPYAMKLDRQYGHNHKNHNVEFHFNKKDRGVENGN